MERMIKGIPAREMPEDGLFGQVSPLLCLGKRTGIQEERKRRKRHA